MEVLALTLLLGWFIATLVMTLRATTPEAEQSAPHPLLRRVSEVVATARAGRVVTSAATAPMRALPPR